MDLRSLLQGIFQPIKNIFGGSPPAAQAGATPAPREGYDYIPGTNIQAPLGSDLLTNHRSNPTETSQPIVSGSDKPVIRIKEPEPYTQKIVIPNSQSADKKTHVDPQTAQYMMENFDDIGEATRSAQVLHHPYQEQVKGYGYGENASFKESIDASNEGYDTPLAQNEYVGDVKGKDGKWHSVDRGLFRVNSRTFHTLIRSPEYRKQMYDAGIIDRKYPNGRGLDRKEIQKYWDRMNDNVYNIAMARIIYNFHRGWGGWYAAPKEFVK